MSDEEKKIMCFNDELNSITEENLKEFVCIILKETGEWFYHDPASTTGNYHPKFALGDGGLVRHTKAVVMFLNDLLRSDNFKFTEHEKNLLRVAAITHDIRKHSDAGAYHKDHAAKAAQMILDMQEKHPDLLNKEDALYIKEAIESHMGKWDAEKYGTPYPTTNPQIILSFADIIASRKYINIDFEDLPKIQENNPHVPEKIDYKTYIIPYGKYSGRTIPDLYDNERSYYNWMEKEDANNPNGFGKKAVLEAFRDLIRDRAASGQAEETNETHLILMN